MAVLPGSGNPVLAQAIADCLDVPLVPCHAHIFSEGNVFVRVKENVRGRDVFVVQGVHYPVNDNFMELLFWIDALKRASAQSVTAVIPFFSYAKGDKKDEPRVSIRARVCADAIEAAGADRVLTMDLHSPQIQGFFSIPVDHLYARHTICKRVREMEIPDLVVCSPDTGFAKDAVDYAQVLDVPAVFGCKQRTGHDERARIVADLADNRILILRNHGLLTVGKTVGEAFTWMYRAERACRMQLAFQQSGAELFPVSADVQRLSMERSKRFSSDKGHRPVGKLEWPAYLRKLDRLDQSYKT